MHREKEMFTDNCKEKVRKLVDIGDNFPKGELKEGGSKEQNGKEHKTICTCKRHSGGGSRHKL